MLSVAGILSSVMRLKLNVQLLLVRALAGIISSGIIQVESVATNFLLYRLSHCGKV